MRQTLEELRETTSFTECHSREQTTRDREEEARSLIPQERLHRHIQMLQDAEVAELLQPDQQSLALVSILNSKPRSRASGLRVSLVVFGLLAERRTLQPLRPIHPRISAGLILRGFPVLAEVAEPQFQIAAETDIEETAAAVVEASATEEPQVSAGTAELAIAGSRLTHESSTRHRIIR